MPRVFLSCLVLIVLALAGCAGQRSENLTASAPVDGLCPVHHVKMHKERVPILYGLIAFEPGSQPIEKTLRTRFPYADRYVLGGCSIDSISRWTAIVLVCPLCLKAEKEWEVKHDPASADQGS